MNDLKDHNQQIDALLDDIIASDDPHASAERAKAVYQLVSGVPIGESFQAELAKFHAEALKERHYNELQLRKLRRSRFTSLGTLTICAVLLVIALVYAPRSSAAFPSVMGAGLVAVIITIYDRRLSALEAKVISERLQWLEMMNESLRRQVEPVPPVESHPVQAELENKP